MPTSKAVAMCVDQSFLPPHILADQPLSKGPNRETLAIAFVRIICFKHQEKYPNLIPPPFYLEF
jgi:hypothetical protein